MLNVTKFRIQILCSLHCIIGRSTRTIGVLSAYYKCVHVEDRYQHVKKLSTMLSMLALLEVAYPLAAFGGSMRPWYYLLALILVCVRQATREGTTGIHEILQCTSCISSLSSRPGTPFLVTWGVIITLRGLFPLLLGV